MEMDLGFWGKRCVGELVGLLKTRRSDSILMVNKARVYNNDSMSFRWLLLDFI
jgi:hypothetical protein